MKKIDYKKLFVYGYIVLVTCVVPFVTFDKYFDLTKSKGLTFIIGSICLLVIYLISSNNENHHKLSIIEKASCLLLVVAFVSTLLARPISSALWGDTGTYMGLLTYVVGLLVLLILVRNSLEFKNLDKLVCIINTLLFSVNIFHALNIDIFNMHSGIAKVQYYDYLGTMGNVNWIVGYLAVMFIYYLYKYLNEDSNDKYIYLLFLVIGVFNIHLVHSDAIYLSLAVAAMFMIPYIFKNKAYILKVLSIVLAYVISGFILNLEGFESFRLNMTGISAFMIQPVILVVLLVLVLACYCYIKKCEYKSKWWIIILESIVVLMLMAVVIDLVRHYVSYNYYWGNNRLNTWVNSKYIYDYYYTDMNRLLGVGPDMLYYVYEEVSLAYGATLVNAHNCFVQVLMSLGIVGLICFIGLIASVVYVVVRKGLFGKDYFIYFVCLVAFFAQMLVNDLNGNNIGLLVLLLAQLVSLTNKA